LNTGLLKDNTIWCYDFDTYALEILLDRCREGHTPLDLCPEKLQTLIDYDQEHNRNYVHILKTYLECNMSVAKAMKLLYVQRATLLYQLKRIEEISQLDLHDYQTRLYLMLYFQITE
jgi:DNA-binding PucR family transcriptional regulator